MAQQVAVLVGTNKGAFSFSSDAKRRTWCRTGPHLSGWEVSSLLGEARAGGAVRIFAGTNHLAYGATIRVSDAPSRGSGQRPDEALGERWTEMLASPRFAKESGATVKRIWQIVRGAGEDSYYAGVEDAGLFVSRDGGTTWSEVEGLNRHPSRGTWQRSKGGLALHSIVVDPGDSRGMWVAISGAGVFRTVDGGATWHETNHGLPHGIDGDRFNHRLIGDAHRPGVLYLQHLLGLYRSRDGGESWQAIGRGLPSTFGFPLTQTWRGDLFAAPLENMHERYMPGGKLQLYRSRDGGETWTPVSAGLPETPSYVSILRGALAVDALDPPGVYFGTSAGEVFASADAGDTWQPLPGQFARITCLATVLR